MPPENKSEVPPDNSPENSEPTLKQIRTFQGDIALALKRQEESLVSIQRAEHVKTGPPKSPEELARRKKHRQFFFLVLGSLTLFVIGGAGAWYTFDEFTRKTTTPITAGPANQFVSTNLEVEVVVASSTRLSIINILLENVQQIPDGQVAHINLKSGSSGTDSLLPTSTFLERLETGVPGPLIRAFDPLFMMGAIGTNSTSTLPSTFIIIKLVSFENAFAGMLVWEPELGRDLGPLFTTASRLANLISGLPFTDITDRNKDIRTLSVDGEQLLLYSFFDSEYLIITDKLETMRLVIDRLTREKLSR